MNDQKLNEIGSNFNVKLKIDAGGGGEENYLKRSDGFSSDFKSLMELVSCSFWVLKAKLSDICRDSLVISISCNSTAKQKPKSESSNKHQDKMAQISCKWFIDFLM